ncbi:uncharacterized protein LOC123291851 [Chrysoperla carnea]|uniref:uncharacterized protein LOC123291851 n=1 Tax=Chrysoperla carnea TaxID=189513 RepID=UPI001D083569|nr:uncharacterized protein LOC123291851 [Chrysoperla carnea]
MRVSSCCCCFSLRTGTLILGYLGGIVYTLVSLGIILSLPYIREEVEEEEKDESLTPEELELLVTWTKVVSIATLVVYLGRILISVLLLIGVYKEKPKLIKIYLIVAIIGVIIDLFPAVILLIGCFSNTKLIGAFISDLLAIALHVYFITVIHSHRMEIIEIGGSSRGGSNLPRQA